ncbi:MAG: SpoIIE family protein phosphatase [Blautia sp.]|nr:SpoIIE family protein phosphatase [Blautia sp.]MCM1199816.1 SpoIIE family protein phosphatase [Bacteroides fragilis]
MRKQAEIKEDNIVTIIPEYGRQKLLGYAESFRDLAELFEEEGAEIPPEDKDRQEYLWQKKLCESRGLLAEHLKEMAHIMADVAKESYQYHPVGERKYRQIAHALKEAGILLKNFMILENEDGHLAMSLMMKTQTQESVAIEDVADLISVAMNIRVRASEHTPLFMAREWSIYYFLEEPVFHILTGFAKATKETEKISGDNYSFCETEQGRMTAILSDGMGSGEKACEESGRVIEMMERLIEAGFRKEAAVQIINGALAAGEQEQNMSTLDICELNLYTGACEFMKIGAACTYIKREHLVDRLSARNLPLGVFQQIEPETIHRQLQDGDYIIMLSDGVLDALEQGIGEEILPELIGKISHTNPGEIARQILNYCLHQSKGKVRDDMTVLVIGMWRYC